MEELSNELRNISLSKEEQDELDRLRKKLEQEMFQAFRNGYVEGTPSVTPTTELRAKPLSKEDFDRFKEEWNKAMSDPKDPPKIYPLKR